MNIENNKELLLKPCIQRIEELYQDNKMLVEKYKEFFTNYYMRNEIARQFKRDIIELEKQNINLKNIIKDKNDEIYELKRGNIDGPKLLDINKYKEYVNKENTDNNNVNEINSLDIKEKVIELNIKETDEYKNLQIELKELKEDYIQIQNKKDKVEESNEYILLKSNYENLLNERNNETDNNDENENQIKELQNKVDILTKQLNTNIKTKTSKTHTTVKQEYDILSKYPIKVYKDIYNSKIKQLIASEVALKIKFQCKIAEETNKNEEDITMDEIIDYIIKQEGLTPQVKSKIKYKFERCVYLNENYGDYLNIFKFGVQHLGFMSSKDWNLWVIELENLIKENFPNFIPKEKIKCKYIYKRGIQKGQSCDIINCRRHKDIN
jgi:hypothetical protein